MEVLAFIFFTIHLFFLHLVSAVQFAWTCLTRRFTIPIILLVLIAISFFSIATWQLYNKNIAFQIQQRQIAAQLLEKKRQEIEFWENQSQTLQSRVVWLKLGELYNDLGEKDKASHALQKAKEIDPN